MRLKVSIKSWRLKKGRTLSAGVNTIPPQGWKPKGGNQIKDSYVEKVYVRLADISDPKCESALRQMIANNS